MAFKATKRREIEMKAEHNLAFSSGRSMLETIAVLAVIGILSVAAIMGLTYIKEKNTANQVMKEAVTQAAEIKARKKHLASINSWR